MAEALHELVLAGCTPEPLMNYLKALGILRLVSEQADTNARAAWRGDVFVLWTKLDRDSLMSFFTHDYEPSPIMSPWNGEGGFLSDSGTSVETVESIEQSANPRIDAIKRVIKSVREIPLLKEFAVKRECVKELGKKNKAKTITSAEREELGKAKARVKEIKGNVVTGIRSGFSDRGLDWLDACMVIGGEGFVAAPTLGSGGVDGRMDFGANFLTNVLRVLQDDASADWIRSAVFGDVSVPLTETSIGQFAPGRVGGPNATHGFAADSTLNPWDFVLMLEGVLVLGGAVARRLGASGGDRATFPFTVRATPVGYASSADEDGVEARGELWLPLWRGPSRYGELRVLFAEGRAELSGRPVRRGVDFVRAVASVGVDRGIGEFSRFSLLKRNGKAFLATPVGRYQVKETNVVGLIREVDPWLDSFRRAAGEKNAPSRFRLCIRAIDQAIFELCRYGGAVHLQSLLVAFGRAERELAVGGRFRDEKRLRPLVGLSSDWITQASDGSPEFSIARALAGVRDEQNKIGTLRANLEPVTLGRTKEGLLFSNWAEKDRAVVWNHADLSANLAAVVARRIMDGERRGCEQLPIASPSAPPLGAITAFITGELDDIRIEELMWGLMLADGHRANISPWHSDDENKFFPPRAYALLKLLFLPRALVVERRADATSRVRIARPNEAGGIRIRPEPSILARLRAGHLGDACAIAMRRLRASGLAPLPHGRAGNMRDRDWLELDRMGSAGIDTTRLAAALLIPINDSAVRVLASLVTRGDEDPNNYPSSAAGTISHGDIPS